MPLQFKLYSLKFTNKLLLLAILPFPKIRCKGTHKAIHSSTLQPLPENLTSDLAKKLFMKNEGELKPNKKTNIQL